MITLNHPSGLTQRFAVADLAGGGESEFGTLLQGPVDVVYSDPPWSPGNEKWWRRYAKTAAPKDYNDLLRGWCNCVIAAQPKHVFCEQSINSVHRQLLLDLIANLPDWRWPLLEQWEVKYGSPLRPNVLMHFGFEPLNVNPTGMHGEKMTSRVFDGLLWKHGQTFADPCMGLGMTSRMAHYYRANCIGTELNPSRLQRTIDWLLAHGYVQS